MYKPWPKCLICKEPMGLAYHMAWAKDEPDGQTPFECERCGLERQAPPPAGEVSLQRWPVSNLERSRADDENTILTETIDPNEPPSERENGGQLSFMITRAQKERLRELGHDEDSIRRMKPEDAHRLLNDAAEGS